MIYRKHSTFSFSAFYVLCLFLMHHFQDKPPTAARSSIFHCLITRQSCQPQGLRNNRFVIIPPPNLGPKSSGNLVTWLNTMCTFWHFTHFILSVHCFLKLNCRTIIYSVHTGVVSPVNIHTVKSVNKSVWSPKDRDKGQACINLLPASSIQTNIIYLTTIFVLFLIKLKSNHSSISRTISFWPSADVWPNSTQSVTCARVLFVRYRVHAKQINNRWSRGDLILRTVLRLI